MCWLMLVFLKSIYIYISNQIISYQSINFNFSKIIFVFLLITDGLKTHISILVAITFPTVQTLYSTLSAGVAEYTNFISAEG